MADRKLIVQIVGDATSLERSFRKAGRAADTFGTRMKRNLKVAAIGAGAGGFALITKGLVDSTRAALEAEKAQTRLESALESANVSYKAHGKAIDAAISRTSKLAALDDEELSDAFAKLVRTTGDVTDATEGMALAADIARARNISLEQATKIVEKAHVRQLRGLKGVGVQINANTTSTQALEAAQKKFGGAAARYGKTAAGAQDKLSVAFENLQEKVGSKVLPILQRLSLRLIDLIDTAERNWPRFRRAIDPTVKSIQSLGRSVQAMFKIVRPILVLYFGKVFPVQLKITVTALEAIASAVRILGTVVGSVFSAILRAADKFLGGFQAIAEALSHLPFVGDKFDGVAESIEGARKKLRGLNEQLDTLRGKKVTATVVTKAVSAIEDRRATLPVRSTARTLPTTSAPPVQRRLAVAQVPIVIHTTVRLANDQVLGDAVTRVQEKDTRRSSVGRR